MFEGAWQWPLAIGVVGMRVCPAALRSPWMLLGGWAGLIVVSLLGASIYTQGYLGDLSVTSWLLLLCPLRRKTSTQLTAVLLGLGAILYGGYVGWLPWDTYAWGYDAHLSLGALFALSGLFWVWAPNLGGWIALILAVWGLHGMGSTNMWMVAVDVWCVVYAALWWGSNGLQWAVRGLPWGENSKLREGWHE